MMVPITFHFFRPQNPVPVRAVRFTNPVHAVPVHAVRTGSGSVRGHHENIGGYQGCTTGTGQDAARA